MGFTNTGFETRRFNRILEDLRSALESNLGTPITTDQQSVIGIISSILANESALMESNLLSLSNNLDINKAEGIYLDKLVNYIGLKRLGAKSSEGFLKVWRSTTGTISSSTVFADVGGKRFIATNGLKHNLLECNEVLLTPTTVVNGISYSLTLNSLVLNYVADGNDTVDTVLDYFVTQVTNTFNDVSAVKDNGRLKIKIVDNKLNGLSVSFTNFNLTEIASFNYVQSEDKGQFEVVLNTITSIITVNSTILRSDNPLDFSLGQDLETDELLRRRHNRSLALGGSATIPAIRSSLLQLPNVTDVLINENATGLPVNGLPANSYECIVVNGDTATIAQEIWNTKPAGVETFGTRTDVVEDITGNPHSVKWSRPEEIYIFVNVDYSLYSEEEFPTNGEALIAQAIINYGGTLNLDNDVIPERFIGDVYRSVSGLGAITITIGSSTNPLATSPTGGYSGSPIAISRTQIPIFNTSRVTVTQV